MAAPEMGEKALAKEVVLLDMFRRYKVERCLLWGL
jgi:hypothetical protein